MPVRLTLRGRGSGVGVDVGDGEGRGVFVGWTGMEAASLVATLDSSPTSVETCSGSGVVRTPIISVDGAATVGIDIWGMSETLAGFGNAAEAGGTWSIIPSAISLKIGLRSSRATRYLPGIASTILRNNFV